MLSKTFTTAAAALAVAGFANAQTFTDCNPMETKCPDDEAFGKESVTCDWTSECPALAELPGTTLNYGAKGAVFKIEKETNAPTVATHKRIFFGKVEVELQAAPEKGIVTSIVLESKNLDEIDWEFVGGDNAQVQSNYFGKGDTTTYDRVEYHDVDNPLGSTHKYSIEYTKDHVIWEIDGAEVRRLKYADAKGGSRFPQTPMEVKVGTWVAGGKNSEEGTREWAGGYTDFSKAPFNAYYKSVTITDYAGGDSPTKENIDSYVWGDRTGSWESIKVIKGDGSSSGGDKDDDDKDDDKSTSKTEKATKTAEPTKTKESSSAEETETETETKTKSKSESETDSSTPSPTPSASESGASTTAGAPSSTGGSEGGDDASETGEDGAGETEGPGSAASGLFSSFGRVAVAGVAAAVVAQLF